MPDLMTSPPVLIIAAILAVLLVIGIIKRAIRLLIWIAVIGVILVCLGIAKEFNWLNWFENLFKMAG